MHTDSLISIPLADLSTEHPAFIDFFSAFQINPQQERNPITQVIDAKSAEFWEAHAMQPAEFLELFNDFAQGIFSAQAEASIESLEILAGLDKSGNAEACNLLLKPGEVTCIVGPTGSGKSRLLADIEWLANADTPTKRTVLINGEKPNEHLVNTYGGKLVAQITQNMNFVLDMDVEGFLTMHAQSRFIDNAQEKVKEVIALANNLSGEGFSSDTPVTFLSGGQSRALMIADVACIGQAPIVLIDEIENAGVDKRKALELLVNQEKIVLMATHDPLLILLAEKRVVIKNGGMHKIITTNQHERNVYKQLEQLDATMQEARNFFRLGNEISSEQDSFLPESFR